MTRLRRRVFAELGRAEAQALLDRYVEDLPGRVDALFDEVRREDGPVDRLDFSRESMRPIWTWLMTAYGLPEQPESDQAMRSADPPWWYEFHAPLGQQLGPNLARLVTNIAAYFAQSVLRYRPDAVFVLGRDKRGVDYNMPILRIGAAGRTVDQRVISLAIQAFMGDHVQADPGRLESMFDQWVGKPSPVLRPAAPPYSIEPIRGGPPNEFTHAVTFDDVVAHEHAARVAGFVDLLAREPGIERTVHEDREVVLFRAPRLGNTELDGAVARAWEAADPMR